MSETLTVGWLRELIKDLPDDTEITECDFDESNLHCTTEQFVRDAQFLMFVPSRCYDVWQSFDFEGIDKPIPDGWKKESSDGN